MASLSHPHGRAKLNEVAWTGSDGTFKVLLLNASAAAPAATQRYVSDIVANECSGTGYSRKTLANRTVSVDTTNNRVNFLADNPVYTALSCGTIAYAVIFHDTGSDATATIVATLDGPDLVTSGVDTTLQLDPAGAFYA
jgi:hypothetical protein